MVVRCFAIVLVIMMVLVVALVVGERGLEAALSAGKGGPHQGKGRRTTARWGTAGQGVPHHIMDRL